MKNSDSLDIIYRFSRGFLLGFSIVGVINLLPLVGTFTQILLGASLGVVGWRWFKNMGEKND